MQPPRSLRRLARDLHRSATLLNGWSSRWHWQRRLEAFLADQEQRRLQELERDIRETNDRHLETARLLREKALERLQSIDASRLSPDSLVKLLALAFDMERKALGIDKPATGRVVTRSTVTQFASSETPKVTNHLQEIIQKFSPVSRDVMRQIVTKTLRNIGLGTERVEDANNDSGNIAKSPEHPKDTKASDKDGTQQDD
jgi:hypothetical protein